MTDQSTIPTSVRFPPHEPRASRYVSAGTSVLAHLKLVVTFAAAGLLAGVLLGMVRPPVYAADAQLIVGRGADLTNLAADAGLEPSEQSLAVQYSHQIDASDVSSHVAEVGGTLTASAIPGSTIIRVNATASSKSKALALVTYGAKALVTHVGKGANGDESALGSLLVPYESTEADIIQYNRTASVLQGQIAAGGPNAISEEAELSQLEAKIDAAQLEANTQGAQVQSAYSPFETAISPLQATGPAVYEGSDKKEFLAIGLVGGLLVGALLGVGFAALADYRPGLLRGAHSTRRSSR